MGVRHVSARIITTMAVLSSALLPAVLPALPGLRAGAAAAAGRPVCEQPGPRGYRGAFGESWAQRRLAFERVWPLTQGQGVTVAVIDSGAELDHPMLAGRVSGFIDMTRTGRVDCAGHGTAVASLIAGRNMGGQGIPLSGVAPAVRLLIVKQQNVEKDWGGGDRLPAAIRRAADAQAEVINIAIKVSDTRELRRAVRYALAKDAVIVAAAGNREGGNDTGPAYPASYPGVLSVTALKADGTRYEESLVSSKVDVAAPGEDVYAAWRGHGYQLQANGTSYATAFVSGVAALVRSRHPELSARQVIGRITATADGAAGPATGSGMVDPMQAVTAVLPDESVPAPGADEAASPAGPPDGSPGGATGATGGSGAAAASASSVRFAAPHHADGRTVTLSGAVTGGALSLAGLVVVAGVVVPMGRRRGWRPGRFTFPARPHDDDDRLTGPETGTIGAR